MNNPALLHLKCRFETLKKVIEFANNNNLKLSHFLLSSKHIISSKIIPLK